MNTSFKMVLHIIHGERFSDTMKVRRRLYTNVLFIIIMNEKINVFPKMSWRIVLLDLDLMLCLRHSSHSFHLLVVVVPGLGLSVMMNMNISIGFASKLISRIFILIFLHALVQCLRSEWAFCLWGRGLCSVKDFILGCSRFILLSNWRIPGGHRGFEWGGNSLSRTLKQGNARIERWSRRLHSTLRKRGTQVSFLG